MIRIITIEREYGCGATGIARELATRLGWKLWDELLTQEIARLANCDQSVVRKREERRDPPYYRLFKSFVLGSWEGSPVTVSAEMLDADSIVRLSEQVVEQAADAGNCVIVGRGSQHFLRARKDTLRFFLYASRREKVHRLVSQGKTEADAAELIDTVDRDRASFIKKYFYVNWPNRSLYHAMLNTGTGDETVILAMMSFLQQSQQRVWIVVRKRSESRQFHSPIESRMGDCRRRPSRIAGRKSGQARIPPAGPRRRIPPGRCGLR